MLWALLLPCPSHNQFCARATPLFVFYNTRKTNPCLFVFFIKVQKAADEGSLGRPMFKTLNAGLALAAAGHLAVLGPMWMAGQVRTHWIGASTRSCTHACIETQ
jgi:hypothetical protein